MQAALALNLDSVLLRTAMPLLQSGEVDAIEWSFDAMGHLGAIPAWWTDLLNHYGQAGRLVGHGVFFSLFDGRWRPEQAEWLNVLSAASRRSQLQHVTEHFGFMSGDNFHQGAPLSIPMNARTLALGRDRLARVAAAAQCRVGLENLALAYSADDVARQGDFLHALIEPSDGFLILDLHNLYCQSHNFGIDPTELMQRYPLERVHELHISGGSWENSTVDPERVIRRDTHDDRVPEQVFSMLEWAIKHCPNVRLAVYEHMSTQLVTKEDGAGYRADFRRMRELLPGAGDPGPLYTSSAQHVPQPHAPPLEDPGLYAEQRTLVSALLESPTPAFAKTRLARAGLATSDWQTDSWDDAMLETAMRVAQKWA